jgi:hypothetical protein
LHMWAQPFHVGTVTTPNVFRYLMMSVSILSSPRCCPGTQKWNLRIISNSLWSMENDMDGGATTR